MLTPPSCPPSGDFDYWTMTDLSVASYVLFIYALFLSTFCSASHTFGDVRLPNATRNTVRSQSPSLAPSNSSSVALPTPPTQALSIKSQGLNTTTIHSTSFSFISTSATPTKAASSNNPTPTSANSTNPTTPANDLDTIAQRRITNIISTLSGVASIPAW